MLHSGSLRFEVIVSESIRTPPRPPAAVLCTKVLVFWNRNASVLAVQAVLNIYSTCLELRPVQSGFHTVHARSRH